MTKIRFYDFDDRFERVKFTLLLRDYGNISIPRAKRLMEELIDNGDITFVLTNTFDKDSLLDAAKNMVYLVQKFPQLTHSKSKTTFQSTGAS